MVDQALLDLKYGHFGHGVYSLRDHDWFWGRRGKTVFELRRLGSLQCLLQGTKSSTSNENVRAVARSRFEPYNRTLDRSITELITDYPELQPARGLFSTLHRASEAVTSSVAASEPAQGDLFKYGSITSNKRNGHMTQLHLLALPGGSSGEALQLIRVRPHQFTYFSGKKVERKRSHLVDFSPTNEVGWWVGKGAPILQICFSESINNGDGASSLAVRLPGTTVIIKPSYEKQALPPCGAVLDCAFPPSRILARPLFEVTPAQSRTEIHADVAYNPWNHREFAIVDHCGRCAVFDIESIDFGPDVAKLRRRGTLAELMKSESTTDRQREDQQDGWARVVWAGNTNTIIICTRRHIATFDTQSGAVAPINLPSTHGLPCGYHLDIARCPGHPDWMFLLTSEEIFWIQLSRSADSDTGQKSSRTKVLLRSRHFRNSRDFTLRMKLMDDSEGKYTQLERIEHLANHI
jgi:RNA polymerase I-specific transcription initiation factor RRN6